MKNFNKSQVIIFVIALMLISAGYLNYTATNGQNSIETGAEMEETQYGGIGDAKLVSSNIVEDIVPNDSNDSYASNEIDTNSVEVQQTNTTVSKDEYFTNSRLERDTMYSQMLESYQKILENDSIPSDQKSVAQTEVKKINDLKNAIMICENLIKTKGFEDIIIFVNDTSVSVIVKAQDLGVEQIAQIQNIVSREIKTDIDDIHISNR